MLAPPKVENGSSPKGTEQFCLDDPNQKHLPSLVFGILPGQNPWDVGALGCQVEPPCFEDLKLWGVMPVRGVSIGGGNLIVGGVKSVHF